MGFGSSDGLLESRMLLKAHVRFGGGQLEQQVKLLAGCLPYKEGLDLLELPTLIETGIEYRLNDLRQRDRRSWRLTQDRAVKVIFLYYENTWQETALQLVAAKLKAAHMVEGNLAEGLAAMELDDGNLMDALMQAVAQGRANKTVWQGLPVAEVTAPVVFPKPQREVAFPLEDPETDLAFTEVLVDEGAIQYAFL